MIVQLVRPAEESIPEPALWLAGEQFLCAYTGARFPKRLMSPMPALAERRPDEFSARAAFDRALTSEIYGQVARQIVAATGKPGDGIVSRWINRPISQAISRQLLRWKQIRPVHATAVTAVLAVAMVICLLTMTGRPGLVAGALLYQAASIFDGVDGEIARATFRTSRAGAKLDSLVDAFANIGFIGGVAINLWISGHTSVAVAGLIGLIMLALGLCLIGRQAANSEAPFTFNGVKERIGATGSHFAKWLTWLTMRDFYALAALIFVLSGFTEAGLLVFATVATGWLAVVLIVMNAPVRHAS